MSATAEPRLAIGDVELGLTVVEPVDRRALVAVAAAAVAFDLVVSRGPGLSLTLLVVALTAGLVGSGRLVNRPAVGVALGAPLFGLFLLLRLSPPLVMLNVLAAAGLLALAASLARGGDPLDLTVPDLGRRSLVAFGHGCVAPAFLLGGDGPWPGRTEGGDGWAAVARGALLAAPVVLVIGLLLGTADPLFASWFDVDAAGDLVGHAIILVVGAWAAGGLLRMASSAPPGPLPTAARRLGFVESLTVLGSLVALYAAFAVAQVVAARGGGRRVLETAGLSYADYARSGFFQLLAAATITLGVLLAVRACADLSTPSRRRRFVVLAEVAVALTLVIVAVAVHRLRLYEDAYGLTLARLFAIAFALWVGQVFVFLALSLAGVHAPRRWLVPAALAAGLVAVVALNLADPETLVVERNVTNYERTGRLDVGHLAALSDDAVPAMVAALPRLDPTTRELVRQAVCAGAPSGGRDWLNFSASATRAADARARVCPPPI